MFWEKKSTRKECRVKPARNRYCKTCLHEDTDTRVMIHANNAAREGKNTIMIKTVNTDVNVIAISVYHAMRFKLFRFG